MMNVSAWRARFLSQKVRRFRQNPSMPSSVLPRRSKAWYDGREGRALVDIVNVHFDDEPPYYTIHLAEGVERSTVRSRLTPVTAEEVAGIDAAAARKRAESAAAEALSRSSEDALLEAIKLLGGNGGGAATGSAPSARRAPSPGRKRKPQTPAKKSGSASVPDEKSACTGGECMACHGKKKSVYVQCEECKRDGVAEYRRILCASCSRTCEACGGLTLCPKCKRDVHTSCRGCGVSCRRRDYFADTCKGLAKGACTSCKRCG